MHTGFKNDGFESVPQFVSPLNHTTIASDGFVPLVGGGYGIHFPYAHVSAMLYVPLGSAVHYAPGGKMLTIGFDAPLWKPHGREMPLF